MGSRSVAVLSLLGRTARPVLQHSSVQVLPLSGGCLKGLIVMTDPGDHDGSVGLIMRERARQRLFPAFGLVLQNGKSSLTAGLRRIAGLPELAPYAEHGHCVSRMNDA